MKRLTSQAPVGASLVILSSFFYASYGIWTTLMGDFFGGYTAAALRSIIVLCIMVPPALVLGKLGPLKWKENRRSLIAMMLAAMLIWGPFYYAILEAGIGVALSINYSGYVTGMLFFGWLIGKEPFTTDKAAGLALGVVGLGLVFSPNVAAAGLLALGAALISGLAAGFKMVVLKQLTYNPTESTALIWLVSAVANIPMAFLIREEVPVLGLHAEWFYLLIFAVMSIFASFTLMQAFKHIEAGAAGVIGLLEIVFGVAFGIFLFQEEIQPLAGIGILLILLAASIPYFAEYRGAMAKK